MKDGSRSIEMKGAGAIISNRIQGHKDLWGAYRKKFNGAKDNTLPPELQDDMIWNSVLKKSNIKINDLKLCSDTINQFLEKLEQEYLPGKKPRTISEVAGDKNSMDSDTPKKTTPTKKIDPVAFKKLEWKIMFGALMRSYLLKIDTMLIINTADNLGADLEDSTVMNYPIISLERGTDNWYKDGLRILQYLESKNLTIGLGGRDNSGQSGFKVTFRALPKA